MEAKADDKAERAFWAALQAAKGTFAAVHKDGTNPHLRNAYATLGAVLEAVEPSLHINGISIVQTPAPCGDGWALETVIRHRDGHQIAGLVPLIFGSGAEKLNPMQGLGSAISYARRYALMSMLSLTAEDDDGATAGAPTIPQRQAHRNGNGNGQPRTGKALFAWAAEAKEDTGVDVVAWLGKWGERAGVGSKVTQWPEAAVADAYAAAVKAIDKHLASTEGGNDD